MREWDVYCSHYAKNERRFCLSQGQVRREEATSPTNIAIDAKSLGEAAAKIL